MHPSGRNRCRSTSPRVEWKSTTCDATLAAKNTFTNRKRFCGPKSSPRSPSCHTRYFRSAVCRGPQSPIANIA
jgi:hypothetical protein